MFATLLSKFGRQFLIAAVVALASALARRAVDRLLPEPNAGASPGPQAS